MMRNASAASAPAGSRRPRGDVEARARVEVQLDGGAGAEDAEMRGAGGRVDG